MKLTARQALEIGLELWEWLEDNPSKEKHEWPGWEKYERMAADCPCCEYKDQQDSNDCGDCLIYWRLKLGLDNHCTYYDSPFLRWCNAETPRSSRFWAGKVAKLHREALEKLEKA